VVNDGKDVQVLRPLGHIVLQDRDTHSHGMEIAAAKRDTRTGGRGFIIGRPISNAIFAYRRWFGSRIREIGNNDWRYEVGLCELAGDLNV
jgi:hypothetical protein